MLRLLLPNRDREVVGSVFLCSHASVFLCIYCICFVQLSPVNAQTFIYLTACKHFSDKFESTNNIIHILLLILTITSIPGTIYHPTQVDIVAGIVVSIYM